MPDQLPRGVRNANPGNIRWGDEWQGLVPAAERTDKSFCQFTDPSWGIRAIARVLIAYQDKYKLRTVRKIIGRWAPPVENDTGAYVNAVAKQIGRDPDQQLDMHNFDDLAPLVEAIIRHENGRGPLNTPNTWYRGVVIETALQRAGVVKRSPTIAAVPVTKETVGATGAAAVGAAQIADVMPQISSAISGADAHLSSGSIVQIVLGVVTIGIAVYIAWSQVKKHKEGVVA